MNENIFLNKTNRLVAIYNSLFKKSNFIMTWKYYLMGMCAPIKSDYISFIDNIVLLRDVLNTLLNVAIVSINGTFGIDG